MSNNTDSHPPRITKEETDPQIEELIKIRKFVHYACADHAEENRTLRKIHSTLKFIALVLSIIALMIAISIDW